MAASTPPTRLSAGVVVVHVMRPKVRYLLLRAYRNWDFPKGLVETGENPIDAALREVREEPRPTLLSCDGGRGYIDPGPYTRGKIPRYSLARSPETAVSLPINPEIGRPEHHEARWMEYDEALGKVSDRLMPV